MNDKMNFELYETSDFGLTIYLSLSFPIIDIKKDDPKRSYFVFEKSPEFIEALDAYWKGTAVVNPNKYYLQMKMIKSRIYANA